jgi:hypothetical protein
MPSGAGSQFFSTASKWPRSSIAIVAATVASAVALHGLGLTLSGQRRWLSNAAIRSMP